MKQISFKILLILLGMTMVFSFNGCDGDGKDGAHSQRNLVNEGEPPVADAGAAQTVVAGDTITLNGSASYDPDGTIESYVWNLGDLGSKEGEIITEIIPDDTAAGAYTVTLVVTDNDGNTDSDTATITVESVDELDNTAPVANAGNNQNVSLGNYQYGEAKVIAAVEVQESVIVELDGSGSSDDGLISPLTYTWKLLRSDTSTKPVLDNNMTDKPKFTLTCETAFADIDNCIHTENNSITCKYIYELRVFDGELSTKDDVTITATYEQSCFPE